MIEVLRSGLATSFQDRGRFGYRNQGVPLSGAMDFYSALLANQLLGNSNNLALIEFVLQGPKLFFHQAQKIAITGGDWKVTLNSEKLSLNTVINVPTNSELDIKGSKHGMYGYLAVEGGWKLENVLDSFSQYGSITAKSNLQKGDKIKFNNSLKSTENKHASVGFQQNLFGVTEIEVEKGPEFEKLSTEQQEEIFTAELTPSKDSNRMAYPLKHELKLKAKEIITSPVQPGTVQLTPSGKLIVLMRDAQTTGGYARILQLSSMGINQLAQKRPGERFKFKGL